MHASSTCCDRREIASRSCSTGGHMRAQLEIGHETFLEAGWSVLQPARPGYGRTPLSAGPDNAAFADRIASLCERPGYRDVAAVGVAAGGRTAMTFAARHPGLVHGLILESSTSFLPWPDPFTRAIARIAFRPHLERGTWAITRLLFSRWPAFTLKGMLSSLSTIPASIAYQRFDETERTKLIGLLSRMRSGQGFANDLCMSADVTQDVRQPTLVVASRFDAVVSREHAQSLVSRIKGAELVLTNSLSHLIWIGPHADEEQQAVTSFLARLR